MPSPRMLFWIAVVAIVTIAIVFRSPLRGTVVGS